MGESSSGSVVGYLVQPTHSAPPVIPNPKDIDHIDPFSDTRGSFLLPPSLALVCKGRLIVTVNETTAAALVTNHDDDLANPAGDVLDSIPFIAGQGLLHIDQIWGQVTHKVHISSGCAEGHDHALLLDEGLGLSVESLEEGACSLKFIFLTRLHIGQVTTGQFTGRSCLLGCDVGVRGSNRLRRLRWASLANGMLHLRSVDQNKDPRSLWVDVFGEVGQDRLRLSV